MEINKIRRYKYGVFKTLNNNAVEVYTMWLIIILTIIVLISGSYLYITDYSDTYSFVNGL